MRTTKLILATSLALSLVLTTSQLAAAASQEFTIPNNSDGCFVERSSTTSNSPTPESATLRVLDGSVDSTKLTPSGEQFEWIIPTADSATTRTFEVEMDGEVSLQLHQESGAIFVNLDESPVAIIKSPWAKDANGLDVQTYFSVEGNRFTQHVETSSGDYAYPITADPRFDWGIVSGHAYFSKEETRKMAASSAAAAAISPFWVLVPPPAGEAIGYWWASNSYSVAAWATSAIAQDKCLVLKFGVTGTKIPPSVGVSPDHYTDGCV